MRILQKRFIKVKFRLRICEQSPSTAGELPIADCRLTIGRDEEELAIGPERSEGFSIDDWKTGSDLLLLSFYTERHKFMRIPPKRRSVTAG